MSVPVPVNITIAQPPVGWKAQSPNLFQELTTLVASLLSGSITASFLTGQINGSEPSADVGPWANGDEWWFYDPTTSQYWPSQQGCPIGSVLMWGTKQPASVPSRWLLCNGQQLNVSDYPRLFAAIGYTWGGSGGAFGLPPGAVIFLNAAGWNPTVDPNADYSQSPDGVTDIVGGVQTAKLIAAQLPAAQIQIPFLNTQMINGNTEEPNIQQQGDSYLYPVTDENGNPVGTNQQAFSTMPPFVTVHFVIKYM